MRTIEEKAKKRISKDQRSYLTRDSWLKDVLAESQKSEGYRDLREEYTKMLRKAIELADKFMVSHRAKIQSTPVEGNIYFEGSYFESILSPPTSFADLDTPTYDAINQVIGCLERQASEEFTKLINPLYWLKEIAVFVIKLPYTLLKLSEFDVKILQEHLIGKILQFIYVLLLIWALLKLGVDIANVKIGI
ncbi:MAG: hypothetical protein ACOYZ8_10130 [Chloroflexota bacterium]